LGYYYNTGKILEEVLTFDDKLDVSDDGGAVAVTVLKHY
jgi:hypothetical protein